MVDEIGNICVILLWILFTIIKTFDNKLTFTENHTDTPYYRRSATAFSPHLQTRFSPLVWRMALYRPELKDHLGSNRADDSQCLVFRDGAVLSNKQMTKESRTYLMSFQQMAIVNKETDSVPVFSEAL